MRPEFTHHEPQEPTLPKRRPDEYHVYLRHADRTYFLAEDGCFVPELERGRAFTRIEDAFEVINRMVEGRALPREHEPGVVRNAYRWYGPNG